MSEAQTQTALVTGASRGIGAAIALQLAQSGFVVIGTATSDDGAAKISQALKAHAGCRGANLNVNDAAAVEALVEQITKAHGGLHVLVNNAGIYKARPFLEYEPNDFRDLFEVNLMGTVHLTQAALKPMLAKQSGRIINIASSAGKAGSRNQSAYNVSKHAVVGLTRCLALETATQGVTVNAICPGLTQTDMVDTLNASFANAAGVTAEQMLQSILTRVPMNRLLNVDEIAGMAVYLGSEESSGMTGQAISIDGGMLTA